MNETNGHVLIVDDNKVNRLLMSRSVELLGHRASVAENGQIAMQMLDRGSFDVLLLDIEMPEMDGYTFTTEVRKDPRLSELHILLHTSLSGVFNRAMVEKVGANDFIAKFQPDELAKTVLERLKHWRSARAA